MSEVRGIKRTKIIATLGPAITGELVSFDQLKDNTFKASVMQAYERMEALFRSGVNVVRLNFSHGNHECQGVKLKIVRDVAKKLNIPVAILLDTKGPEIRVGNLKGNLISIKTGEKVEIYTTKKIIGEKNKFSVSDSSGTYNMANDLKKKDQILIDDGKLTLKVDNVQKFNGVVHATSLNSHVVWANKRINLPGVKYSMPFLSDKDIADIKYGIENKVDIIAASFVNNSDDVKKIRNILKEHCATGIKIISKIESANAISNIDDIIQKSDGIMVARGDLALEIPYYEIPYWEKYIIKACRLLGKKCIVATQMLDSLEKNVFPTRAEVTDVFYAVERGTDATMLSGESASGLHPINAVEVMNQINLQSEQLFDYGRSIDVYYPKTTNFHTVSGRIIWELALKCAPRRMLVNNTFKYDFIVVFTNDFKLLDAFSNIRFPSTIIAVTTNKSVYLGCGVSYGVYTYLLDKQEWKDDITALSKNEQKLIAQSAIKHYCNIYNFKRNYSCAIFDYKKNCLSKIPNS